jgi:hypothetical protein
VQKFRPSFFTRNAQTGKPAAAGFMVMKGYKGRRAFLSLTRSNALSHIPDILLAMKTKNTLRYLLTTLLVLIALVAGTSSAIAAGQPFQCEPTPDDEMGPFYRPDAVYRNSVGVGYLLFGTVKSASDCRPVANATLELWMTGPEGRYGDAWRATLLSAENGNYHFTSHVPTDFGSRRAHIHIRVTAEGFAPLVTQHYVAKGAGEALFDLVLIPLTQQ